MKQVAAVLASGLLVVAASSGAAGALNCTVKPGLSAQQAHAGLCGFDPVRRSFAGGPAEQAACLLRTVKEGGNLGAASLPSELAGLVGKPTDLPVEAVRAFLARSGIAEAEVGGPVVGGVGAGYFIIHDTSAPNCSEPGVPARSCPQRGEFPPDRDDAGWVENSTFNGYATNGKKVAHAMTNRAGRSMTMVDFARHIPTTKFESCADASRKVGLFIGVENVQPRIGRPAVPAPGRRANDLVAPTPGFSPSQYDRLALLYVVASVRHGAWLIPAYHAVLDQIYADGHDDPQHFEIAAFSAAVQRVVGAMRGS